MQSITIHSKPQTKKKGKRRTLNKGNQPAGTSTHARQGVSQTLGGASNGGTGGGRDARQALGGLGLVLLRGVGGLLRRGALEAAGGDVAERQRLPQQGTCESGRHCVVVVGRVARLMLLLLLRGRIVKWAGFLSSLRCRRFCRSGRVEPRRVLTEGWWMD